MLHFAYISSRNAQGFRARLPGCHDIEYLLDKSGPFFIA